MKYYKYIVFALLIFFITQLKGVNQVNNYEVPSGRTFEVNFDSNLTTASVQMGEIINTTIENGFYDDGNLILPPCTKVIGKVTFLERASNNGLNGAIKIDFTQAKTPLGHKIPLVASIETKDGSGILTPPQKNVFSRFGKGVLNVGKKAGITFAKHEVIKEIVPEGIRKIGSYVDTAVVGGEVVQDVKKGDDKQAAEKTAEQVVKYTPYGMAYKYGKDVVKGVQSAKSSNDDSDSCGVDVEIYQGEQIELILNSVLIVKQGIQ